MKNLNSNEIEQVSGGFLDEIGYLEDALVIGGGTLSGAASATITAPILVIAGAVTVSYYGGKWLGSKLVKKK